MLAIWLGYAMTFCGAGAGAGGVGGAGAIVVVGAGACVVVGAGGAVVGAGLLVVGAGGAIVVGVGACVVVGVVIAVLDVVVVSSAWATGDVAAPIAVTATATASRALADRRRGHRVTLREVAAGGDIAMEVSARVATG